MPGKRDEYPGKGMSAWGKRDECPGKGVLEHGYSHSGGSFVIRNFRKVGCYKLLYNSGLLCYSRSDSSWRVLLHSSAGMRVWPGGTEGSGSMALRCSSS